MVGRVLFALPVRILQQMELFDLISHPKIRHFTEQKCHFLTYQQWICYQCLKL
jgi:hypothetical protein